MHPIQAQRDSIARAEVVAHATSHIQGEREVLPLRVRNSERALRVDAAETEAPIEVRCDSPIARDKVAAHSHDVGEVARFRSAWNRDHGSAQLKIPIAAQNSRPSHISQLPSQRSDYGH